MGEKESEALSFDVMEKSLVDDYEFNALDIRTMEEIEILEKQKAAEEIKRQEVAAAAQKERDEDGLIVEDEEKGEDG